MRFFLILFRLDGYISRLFLLFFNNLCLNKFLLITCLFCGLFNFLLFCFLFIYECISLFEKRDCLDSLFIFTSIVFSTCFFIIFLY